MTKNATSSKSTSSYQVDKPNILAPSDWKSIAHDGNPDEVIEGLLGLIDDQITDADYPNFCIFVFGKNNGKPGSLMLSLMTEDISD